jgi:hypothetical protein
MSAATPLSYEQPINAHYEVILTNYIQQNNERPPAGWKRAVLHLPANAQRVVPNEQKSFMEGLLRLIREKCSTAKPEDMSPQGLWIENFEGSDVVNKYLRAGKVKIYPGKSLAESVWIDVAAVAGPWPGSGFFRT